MADQPEPRWTYPVPAWTADAVWYQVLVSRFCNGEASNDPPGVLPWTADWGRLAPGEEPPLRDRLFGRRYGGDLAGLRSKLPYLRALGVNTLYLNPVFQAPSEHKYDTADMRHIDDTYGVAGSVDRLRPETQDPATWQWSASDRLFLDFVSQAHRQGVRVVIDGVFNHVGRECWAWRDVVAQGRASPFAGWFDVTSWGPPLRWQAWDGPNGRLVQFRHYDDGLHPDLEAYLFAVVRRWMDPDGDGDPHDGVDGWRLDAAEKVPHGFWRRFRRAVKELNPEAAIVGEIWVDAAPWLAGDQFDVVTNYRFSGPVMRFFAEGNRTYPASAFMEDLAAARREHPQSVTLGMLNLLGSHDTPRAVTMLTDPQRRRDAAGRIPRPDLLVPDDEAYRRLQLAALFQWTYAGAPLLYYGDEVGMYGGDDPFCRAPTWWPEVRAPGYRSDLLDGYRALGRLRRECPELRRGSFHLLLADDARRLVAFARRRAGGTLGPGGQKAASDRISAADDAVDAAYETVVLINGDMVEHEVVLTLGRGGAEVRVCSWPAEGGADNILAGSRGRTIDRKGRVVISCPALEGRLIRIPRAGVRGGAGPEKR